MYILPEEVLIMRGMHCKNRIHRKVSFPNTFINYSGSLPVLMNRSKSYNQNDPQTLYTFGFGTTAFYIPIKNKTI